MKRKMVEITRLVRPVDSSLRIYLTGIARVPAWYRNPEGVNANEDVVINNEMGIHVMHTDELEPEILFVKDTENTFWVGTIEKNKGSYDIRDSLADYNIEYDTEQFEADDRVYYIIEGEVDYSEDSVMIRNGCAGTYIFGDSAYVQNQDIHITKYISYEGNHNKHVRKALTTLFKGKAFSNEDFCQLLLNRKKRRPYGDEEYEYTRCTLYTNQFIYDCRNGDIVITVNDNRYLITRNDMFLNELYVLRLLTAASAGNLEDVIIDKYPSVLVHMQKEKISKKELHSRDCD